MHGFHWFGIHVLAAALLIGCQSGSPSAPGSAAAQPAAPSVAGAPPGAEPEKDAWEQVVAAARAEGQVLLYVNPGTRPFMEHAIPAFQQEYGVQAEPVYMSGREVEERLYAEHGAGQYRADIVSAANASAYGLYKTGLLETINLPNTRAITERLRHIGPVGTYYPQYVDPYGILVNIQQVPPERLPTRWADLLDPYYRGKIVLHDPTTAGGGNTWLGLVHETPGLGRPYLEQLARQDLLMVQQPTQVESMIARGERSIGLPIGLRALALQRGAPIQYVAPQEGVFLIVSSVAVAKNAPHPNAARVWANFMLSKRAQEWWHQQANYTPVREDVQPEQSEVNLANVQLMGGVGFWPPDQSPHWLEVARSIFRH
jgi:iron(III) transport system substrate-binding protein